ncbi:nitrogenase cofactor biosynthesis protein NifB [Anaerosporobacter sp.]|uniref:nitrogenase cofactor biosynthesis protein NifB n=1 Tax=Anaerosporobacter sp. TaxID=1872529 RepID=UPI00286F6FEB|nr:nitrogenase cofactor biosynthesis protein NifB [Anaerosporobacter sp.]
MKTKVQPLVNLNVNPCKMCMPMGAMTAFCGIKKCVSILHGSQGCSTYIRRHMATHYNEPIDIASSSLTEQGTVYGGESNLKKGLTNLIDLYHPQVVGVATTCLAETIGEDTSRMIQTYYEENPDKREVTIVPVHSAGYAGTQFEGYFAALAAIVSEIEMNSKPHNKINVIASYMSPADMRTLKELCKEFGLEIILLPDFSENLDGVFKENYNRLPEGGTDIADIKRMAGARATIEISNMDIENSPGKILKEKYGVPYIRVNVPVGLRDNDAFLKVLSKISGKKISKRLKQQRGRYLDAMIDSHKYNAEGRAVVFGEPDFIISMIRICEENGIMPVITATGSVFPHLDDYVKLSIEEIAKRYFEEDYKIIDDVDFKDIETAAEQYDCNLMIGNSDGRRIEEHLQIALVRRSFPIHDRIGGQRLKTIGYEGSLTLLDEITNAILSRKESTFREVVYKAYYRDEKSKDLSRIDDEMNIGEKENADLHKNNLSLLTEEEKRQQEIQKKTETHPCYNCAGHKYARMHLPVAPRCNVQCNYCVRKFDCPNESRPGVTTKVLTPEEAFNKYKQVKEKVENLTVVGIAGPGDALANFDETKRTMELIKEYDSDVTFCLSTNGLLLPTYAEDIIKLGVSHVTVTINAVDPKIAGKIYKHINFMGTRYEGESAGAILLSNQLSGLRILVAHGVICKVNIVSLKGINDTHIPKIVETMKEIGCYITNIMPMIPVKGSAFENMTSLTNKEIEKLRADCGLILKQMTHCKQCRADAIGTLDNDLSLEFRGYQAKTKEETEQVYRFAVASKHGMHIDEHFGHVTEWYIYEYKKGEVSYIEKRKVGQYCEGSDVCDEKEDKIAAIIQTIEDCQAVIAMRIGESPRKQLEEKQIKVIVTYDRIEDAVSKAAQTL